MSKISGCFLSLCAGAVLCATQVCAADFLPVVSAPNVATPAVTVPVVADGVEIEKQPVFLFCPHKESAGSWSLYLIVDKKKPTQPLALCLEELAGKNSKDTTYNGCLDAQKNPNTQRNDIARLDAKDFGKSKLEVKENNMLAIGVTPAKDGLHLEINARISLDGYFTVGGAEKHQRDLVLSYSYLHRKWVAKAPTLQDKDGRSAVGKYALALTGIVFLASTTGVSRIAAVDDLGAAILLMDR